MPSIAQRVATQLEATLYKDASDVAPYIAVSTARWSPPGRRLYQGIPRRLE